MSMFQELEYTEDIDTVSGVQFSVMSPEEIRRRSVAEIYTNETYDGDIPKIGGIFDPRMGILDHGQKCPTDELNNRYCPGYMGHIELAKPVFYIHFLKYTLKTLQSICPKCSKLCIDAHNPELKKLIKNKRGWKRFQIVSSKCHKLSSKKRCGTYNNNGCGAYMPNSIKRENTFIGKITATWKKTSNDDEDAEDLALSWDASDVLKIFQRISDEDLETLGFDLKFCRPEWLICTVLPVAPPYVRPSVRADNNTRMEDDLTHKYCDIIKTNKTLKHKMTTNAANTKAIDEWYQLLQYHVATLVNNTLPGIPPAQQRSGRPLKSIHDRLKAKEGRIRGNLMGKRVDFSARSVITPDPRIDIDQLGVPYDICKNLTFPEKVNSYNIDRLRITVKNGVLKYPGAKSIKKKDSGRIISLSILDTSQIIVELGDIVNRHLIKDDIVLFNRQPSLHKMSMMQHRVLPLPYKTFRLNVSVTTPYNADFDGDEMNMHVPQSDASRIEIAELARVSSQIVSPANNKPIISLVQDTCVGSYIFTRYDNFITESEIKDILCDTNTISESKLTKLLSKPVLKNGSNKKTIDALFNDFPYFKFPSGDSSGYSLPYDLWTGRDIFSLILPNLNFTKCNKTYGDNDKELHQKRNKISIVKGEVIDGVFDKHILGSSQNGLIHNIFNDFGMDRTKQFLEDTENIITNYVLKSGFSVGIGDLIPDSDSQVAMKEIVSHSKTKVIELIEHTHQGILERKGGATLSADFETQILGILNQVTNNTGKEALLSLNKNNRMLNLIKSGSKGSEINMGQMIACVGQQAVDGQRIPLGFTDRTLPHFHKYDDGASARGFVENSFMNGLTPTEFFFHAMGGREGLIDTAVKTSETGYIQRKLVKGLEDARILNDHTVRDANNNIIQFLYGGDGFDGMYIEKIKLSTLGKNDDYILDTYSLDISDIKVNFTDEVYKSIITNKESFIGQNDDYIKQMIKDRDYYFDNFFKGTLNEHVFYPINIQRLLTNTIKNLEPFAPYSDLSPLYILEEIKRLVDGLYVSEMYSHSKMLGVLCRIYLSPKIICVKHKLNKIAFDYIISNIKSKFYSAIAVNGELVGTIAAQSIGEPSTQMTLNTFHFAGVASKSSVNQGVPRFKELLSITENLKGPMNTIVLKEPYCYNKELAKDVMNDLSITYIKDLIKSCEIYFNSSFYDDDDEGTTGDVEKTDLFKIHKQFYDILIEDPLENLSPWVLKLEFDKTKMMNNQFTMLDIYTAIIKTFNTDKRDLRCFYTDDNSNNLIMSIQCVLEDQGDNEIDEEDVVCIMKTIQNSIMNDIILKGYLNIKSASMESNKSYTLLNAITGKYEKKEYWEIFTDGSNLTDIITHPKIDPYKTFSNNIWEVYRLLGIEAARKMLYQEINEVFEFSGSYVNSRHISLLVDVMTNKGSLMSIDRHGLNKTERGPLAKCSFEETPDILSKAAVFSDLDKMTSVSANIMLGQEVPIGTGAVDVLFDEEMFFENINNVELTDILETTTVNTDSTEVNLTDFADEYCNNLFD